MEQKVNLTRVEFGWVMANKVKPWSFVQIWDSNAVSVIVEIQSVAPDSTRANVFMELLGRLRKQPVQYDYEVQSALGLTDEECQADADLSRTVSALSTAIVEFQSIYQGVSMTTTLGGEQKDSQLLYANLNRYLRDVLGDRTPKAFGEAAERAAREGFTIVKTDPFDEVRPTHSTSEILEVAAPSLERLKAMRTGGGPKLALQVDCHGSFNTNTAAIIEAELQEIGVTWFEDPVRERDMPGATAKVAATSVIPVSVGGDSYGEVAFSRMADWGVKYTMQDVMRCGGVGVAARSGQRLANRGIQISCHSPFGPLQNLVSAHAHAATPNPHALEHAVWENDWRADLLDPPEQVQRGRLIFPGGVGSGASINWNTLERVGGVRWTP